MVFIQKQTIQYFAFFEFKFFFLKLEEAEWIGLTISQAIAKQIQIEALKMKPKPLKVKLTKDLLARLDGKLIKNLNDQKNIWFFIYLLELKAKGELPEISRLV